MESSTAAPGAGGAEQGDDVGLGVVSSERQARIKQTNARILKPGGEVIRVTSPVDDMVVDVDVPARADTSRQDQPNGANQEAPDGRTLDNPRPIRASRSRRNRGRIPRNSHAPAYSVYYDHDDSRGRAYYYERRDKEPSPETLRNRAEATFVPAMADMDVKDVKEEREERTDRRQGDFYRGGGGGNNKRRRDGNLPLCPRELHSNRARR
jgi:hypothetical protein